MTTFADVYKSQKAQLRQALIARRDATNVKKYQQGDHNVRTIRHCLSETRKDIESFGADGWRCDSCGDWEHDYVESVDGMCEDCVDEQDAEDWS